MSGPNGLYVTRTILSQSLQGDNIDTDSCFYTRLWWGLRQKGFHRDVIGSAVSSNGKGSVRLRVFALDSIADSGGISYYQVLLPVMLQKGRKDPIGSMVFVVSTHGCP